MFVRMMKTRQAQMRLRLDDVPSPPIEIWHGLPSECQLAAMSVLARLMAQLGEPKEAPDES